MKKIIIAALFLVNALFSTAQIQTLFDITNTGSIAATATSAAPLNIVGQAQCSFTLTGTWTATLQIQFSGDNGTTWSNVTNSFSVYFKTNNTYAAAGNISANGTYLFNCGTLSNVRIITTAYTSGTVVITARASKVASSLPDQTTTSPFWVTPATFADAKANPASTVMGAMSFTYNGTTWDMMRGNQNTTTGDAGAKTATFNGATQTNFNSPGATIMVLCGVVSGTSPTMTAQLQISPDGGTTWLSVGAASGTVTTTGNTILFQIYPNNTSVAGATPAALTTGATQTLQLNVALPRTWRFVYTIAGTTPSFAITGVYVSYQAN